MNPQITMSETRDPGGLNIAHLSVRDQRSMQRQQSNMKRIQNPNNDMRFY